MTRGKWVALAVGLAAVVILVPFFYPPLWRAVAYEKERRQPVFRNLPPSPFTTAELRIGFGPVRLKDPGYLLLLRKRFDWLPGRERFSVCGCCVESRHSDCPRRMLVYASLGEVEDFFTWHHGNVFYQRHTCACPHPSHAQESE